ncbi:MAG: hypothetical protein ACREPN_00960, partial [Rudaea sp.]
YYPTWSCSIGASTCGTAITHYTFYLTAALAAQPGPEAAFDELASQTTAVVDYTGGDANGGNVQCTAEQGSIFATNGNPIVALSFGSQSNYDSGFVLANPPTQGSSLCVVTMTDAESGGFPNSESAATTPATFRIVVDI